MDEHHTNLDKKQEEDNKHKAKPEFKIKRAKKKLKENATYESNIGLNLDPSIPSQGKGNEDLTILKDVDLAKAVAILKDCEALIGNKLNRPKPSQLTFSENNYYNFLIFDTETTTIGKSTEMIQIAATTDDEYVFSPDC